MIIVKSKKGVPVRLTQERWQHIVKRHPEMATQQENVLQTISYPDLIQQGDFDTLLAVKFFSQTPLTPKFLIVIYKELNPQDGFVLTAYFTKEPSQRRPVLWKD